jgi:hypothetical protein
MKTTKIKDSELKTLSTVLEQLGWPANASDVAALASNLRVLAPIEELGDIPHSDVPKGMELTVSVGSHILALKRELTFWRKKTKDYNQKTAVKRPRGYRSPQVPIAYAPFVTAEDPELQTVDQAWENYDSVLASLRLACRVYLELCQCHDQPESNGVVLVKDGLEDNYIVTLPLGASVTSLHTELRTIRREVEKFSDGGDPLDEFIFAELAMRGYTSRKPLEEVSLYPFTGR